MAGICKIKGRGNQFQIQCVRKNIISKESRGEDASFERALLKSWAKYEGWEDAQMPPQATKSKSGRVRSKK